MSTFTPPPTITAPPISLGGGSGVSGPQPFSAGAQATNVTNGPAAPAGPMAPMNSSTIAAPPMSLAPGGGSAKPDSVSLSSGNTASRQNSVMVDTKNNKSYRTDQSGNISQHDMNSGLKPGQEGNVKIEYSDTSFKADQAGNLTTKSGESAGTIKDGKITGLDGKEKTFSADGKSLVDTPSGSRGAASAAKPADTAKPTTAKTADTGKSKNNVSFEENNEGGHNVKVDGENNGMEVDKNGRILNAEGNRTGNTMDVGQLKDSNCKQVDVKDKSGKTIAKYDKDDGKMYGVDKNGQIDKSTEMRFNKDNGKVETNSKLKSLKNWIGSEKGQAIIKFGCTLSLLGAALAVG